MQKVMVKGLARDEQSLRESGIVPGSKVMVVGSTFDDVLALSRPTSTPVCYFLIHLFICITSNVL